MIEALLEPNLEVQHWQAFTFAIYTFHLFFLSMLENSQLLLFEEDKHFYSWEKIWYFTAVLFQIFVNMREKISFKWYFFKNIIFNNNISNPFKKGKFICIDK